MPKVMLGQFVTGILYFLLAVLGAFLHDVFQLKFNPYNMLWAFSFIAPIIIIFSTFYFLKPAAKVGNYLMAILGCIGFCICWFLFTLTYWANHFGT